MGAGSIDYCREPMANSNSIMSDVLDGIARATAQLAAYHSCGEEAAFREF